MFIFDAHTHIGRWDENTNFTKEDLLNVLDKNGVEYFCVSNLDGMGIDYSKPDMKPFLGEREANEKLLKTFKYFPQALLYAICEPKHGNPKNIKLLLYKNKGKFVGLKFHSEANQIPANSELYDPYLEIAKEFDLPCLFHSGDLKSPYSSPELIYQLAQRHPDVKIILGHISNGDLESKIRGIEILYESIHKKNCQLYGDFSWCGHALLTEIIKIFSNNIDRIMFGSDSPMVNMIDVNCYNYFVSSSMAAIETYFPDRAEELIQKIFCTNAKNLFKIK